MQRFPKNLTAEDRQTIRRWRLISVGVYASVVAAFILFISFQQNRDISYAAVKAVAPAENMMAPHP
jgi:hypothetical protein